MTADSQHRSPRKVFSKKQKGLIYSGVGLLSAVAVATATLSQGATTVPPRSEVVAALQSHIAAAAADASAIASMDAASPSPSASSTPVISDTSTPTPSDTSTPSPTSTGLPSTYDHVFLIPMENQPRSAVIGNAGWPTVNKLAMDNTQAAHYVASCHPSLPNYLDFTSGSTQGKCGGNDASPILNVPNLFGDLTASGVSWKSYVENLPADFNNWNKNTGSEWEIGNYAAKHEPAVFYQSVMGSASERAKVVDYSQLYTDLSSGNAPAFNYIGLNAINDGHDSCCGPADTAVSRIISAIKASSAWTSDRSLIIITWDEGIGTNQTIAFIAVAKDVKQSYVSGIVYNHHSLLSLIQHFTGDKFDRTGGANPMTDLFSGTPTITPSPSSTSTGTATPSPSPIPSPTVTTSPTTFTWSAPPMTNPTTIVLKDQQGSVTLNNANDYILECPGGTWKNDKGLFIVGGHNVVIVGCSIDVGNGSGTAPSGTESQKRAAYLLVTGEFFGQNLTFKSSTTGHLTEGIDLSGNSRNVTLQGIAMSSPLTGSYSTNHADCMQAWAGPVVLDVDGFVCNTGYQGFFLLPDQHNTIPVVPTDWTLENVHITLANLAYSLWRDDAVDKYTIQSTNVVVTGGRGNLPDKGLWPNVAAWPGVTVN